MMSFIIWSFQQGRVSQLNWRDPEVNINVVFLDEKRLIVLTLLWKVMSFDGLRFMQEIISERETLILGAVGDYYSRSKSERF